MNQHRTNYQKSALSSRGGGPHRTILSMDRAGSIDSNGRRLARDLSVKGIHHSKQKLRRKGSGGLPDFNRLNTQRLKKQIYNTVLNRNRGQSNSKSQQKQAAIASPRNKNQNANIRKPFGQVQITNINVKTSAKLNLEQILSEGHQQPTIEML